MNIFKSLESVSSQSLRFAAEATLLGSGSAERIAETHALAIREAIELTQEQLAHLTQVRTPQRLFEFGLETTSEQIRGVIRYAGDLLEAAADTQRKFAELVVDTARSQS